MKNVKTVFSIQQWEDGFEVQLNGNPVLRHTETEPMIYIGLGHDTMKMYRGNFDIQDYIIERIPLRYVRTIEKEDMVEITFYKYHASTPSLKLNIFEENERMKVKFEQLENHINRFWIRILADEDEKIYGCGEQFSHFNLRGKNFPLWTSEPGVGRNKKTYTTWLADVLDQAGGDYYNTNFPQPTFVSSKKYFCHVDTTAYADFDFRNASYHELQIWEVPDFILFQSGESYIELVENITEFFGRQPELPEWTYNGIWLGIQGGTDVVEKKLKQAREHGIKVGGVWCQDWQGIRHTSFGKRLMWDWKWNPEEYPKLDEKIKEWKREGVRFLGYINPYVAVEGDLFQIAKENGYLALNDQGEVYLVDFGEFYCGIVDFTDEKAFEWYKSVIKEHLIDFGLDGWMADFGEYLPVDVRLKNQKDGKIMHNAWPTLWAKVNYEAVKEAGKLGDIVYFMRAGYTGSQKYCTLLWAGDQSVNWSLDDGLASVIPAALSTGMIGCGLHHSDIGGYTSLHGNKRSKELLLRWADMSAFTPVMRTHESNRPDDCFQYDGDEDSLRHFARMTSIYVKLAPYTKELVSLNAKRGIPVQRPLFMHYEEDEKAYEIQYEYLYGRDLLVAPVYLENQKTWKVYLPEDNWVHIWTGEKYTGGEVEVDAPIGYPPVFYREASKYVDLFKEISTL